MTIGALDEVTGHLGLAICSSSPAVAGRCVAIDGTVGVVAAQNLTNPVLHQSIGAELRAGRTAQAALDAAIAAERFPKFRQILVVDKRGRTAVFSGKACLPVVAACESNGVVAAGNLLAHADVPAQMVAAFTELTDAPLEERLLHALDGALDAGGELGALRSAGLFVAGAHGWPWTNLRVDWDERPLSQLRSLWRVWRPEKSAYEMRAYRPDTAPEYDIVETDDITAEAKQQ